VDPQVWQDWQALRKAKRAPVTATVIEAARREAQKAGMSFEAFLATWCARGSQGMRAEWIEPRRGSTQRTESFAERDARHKRERWEQMTGRQWPDPVEGDVGSSPGYAVGHDAHVIELVEPQVPYLVHQGVAINAAGGVA
jgi:hypothetical protein